jgi:hypothetical protein
MQGLTPAQRRVLEEIARRGPLQRWRLCASCRESVIRRCVERGWLHQVYVGPEVALELTDAGRAALERDRP